MQQKIATVFGATGFIGRHVVRALADDGYTVRAITRHKKKAYFLQPYGNIGQIVPMEANLNEPASVDAAIRGADAVVFLPGVLTPKGRKGFEQVHALYAGQVAEAAMRFSVRRLVHISALSCDKSKSKYAQSKRAGETAVLQTFARATILRPSIVFGAEDGFFGRFAKLASILPALPLIGGGKTKFQPVYVGDVARAVLAAITLPSVGPKNPEGRVYELGGPDVYSFKDLMKKIFEQTGVTRPLMTLPFIVAAAQGAILQNLPGAMLTRDQVTSLKTDNVVTQGARTLSDLGVEGTALDSILPSAMARFREGGPASKKKKAA